jgi:hypothetical protein
MGFFIRGSKMVRFGTKDLDRQNWLPQPQQLTKNKMVRFYRPYHLVCSKALFTHRILAIKLRTLSNAYERPRTPSNTKISSRQEHLKKMKPQIGANHRNWVQKTGDYRKSPPSSWSADIPVRRKPDHLDPAGFRTRMRTRMSALRDASCALHSVVAAIAFIAKGRHNSTNHAF